MSGWKVSRVSGVMGAEIEGVNIGWDLSEGLFDDLASALWEHQVTMFRGQGLTPDQHVEIALHSGEVEEHTFFA